MLMIGSSQSSGSPFISIDLYPPCRSSQLPLLIIKCSIESSDREKMLDHWSIYPMNFSVQSTCMSCQTYAECILCFSNVLDGALFTFNKVDHITTCSSTIGGGFYTKPLASCLATKLCAYFHVGACLAAWLMTLAVSPIFFFCLSIRCSYQKVPKVKGRQYVTKGGFGNALRSRGETLMTY